MACLFTTRRSLHQSAPARALSGALKVLSILLQGRREPLLKEMEPRTGLLIHKVARGHKQEHPNVGRALTIKHAHQLPCAHRVDYAKQRKQADPRPGLGGLGGFTQYVRAI
jgi:hypothetical protein